MIFKIALAIMQSICKNLHVLLCLYSIFNIVAKTKVELVQTWNTSYKTSYTAHSKASMGD